MEGDPFCVRCSLVFIHDAQHNKQLLLTARCKALLAHYTEPLALQLTWCKSLQASEHMTFWTHSNDFKRSSRSPPWKPALPVSLSSPPNSKPPIPHLNAKYFMLHLNHWHLLGIWHFGGFCGACCIFWPTLAGKRCISGLAPIDLCFRI